MRRGVFISIPLLILLLLNIQTLFGQLLSQEVQEIAQKMVEPIENREEIPGLLEDIQNALQPHSDFISNTLSKIQTDSEFEPYIEKYEALKGQYMGDGRPIPVNPNVKVFLSAAPFPRSSGYDESLIGVGVCFPFNSIVIIDRGFWQYYENNDEIREAVLFHELGHCDLGQQHGQNGMMNRVWEDDLLNQQTIHWPPFYEEFFAMQEQRNKIIICSNENSYLYEQCSHPLFLFQPLICPKKEDDTLCYQWKEPLLNEIKNSLPFIECLLFNSNSSICFDSI